MFRSAGHGLANVQRSEAPPARGNQVWVFALLLAELCPRLEFRHRQRALHPFAVHRDRRDLELANRSVCHAATRSSHSSIASLSGCCGWRRRISSARTSVDPSSSPSDALLTSESSSTTSPSSTPNSGILYV